MQPLEILDQMEQLLSDYPEPMIERLKREFGEDPFLVFVACLVSLRSRDVVTYSVVRSLWEEVSSPEKLSSMSSERLYQALRPSGCASRKVNVLQSVSRLLLERHLGKVPSVESDLLALPGVGRKTMALVLSEGFGIPAVCVDTHVHRISQHLGLVALGATVVETEEVLKRLVPRDAWSSINRLFVMWGQHVCKPCQATCSCHIIAR